MAHQTTMSSKTRWMNWSCKAGHTEDTKLRPCAEGVLSKACILHLGYISVEGGHLSSGKHGAVCRAWSFVGRDAYCIGPRHSSGGTPCVWHRQPAPGDVSNRHLLPGKVDDCPITHAALVVFSILYL
jgi:hypothetical protein